MPNSKRSRVRSLATILRVPCQTRGWSLRQPPANPESFPDSACEPAPGQMHHLSDSSHVKINGEDTSIIPTLRRMPIMATAIKRSLRTMAATARTSPKSPKGNAAKIVKMAGANEAKSPLPLSAGSETTKNVSSVPSRGTAMLDPAHFGAGRLEGVGSFMRTATGPLASRAMLLGFHCLLWPAQRVPSS